MLQKPRGIIGPFLSQTSLLGEESAQKSSHDINELRVKLYDKITQSFQEQPTEGIIDFLNSFAHQESENPVKDQEARFSVMLVHAAIALENRSKSDPSILTAINEKTHELVSHSLRYIDDICENALTGRIPNQANRANAIAWETSGPACVRLRLLTLDALEICDPAAYEREIAGIPKDQAALKLQAEWWARMLKQDIGVDMEDDCINNWADAQRMRKVVNGDLVTGEQAREFEKHLVKLMNRTGLTRIENDYSTHFLLLEAAHKAGIKNAKSLFPQSASTSIFENFDGERFVIGQFGRKADVKIALDKNGNPIQQIADAMTMKI